MPARLPCCAVQYAGLVCRPGDGTIMMEGFYQIDSTGLAGEASLANGHLSGPSERMTGSYFRVAIGWLPIVVILGAAAWLLLSDNSRKQTVSQPVRLAAATSVAQAQPPVTAGLAREASFDPTIVEAITPEQPAPVDGLKITSQSWRRGGLGSKAFVTFTLRNINDYAVKDIEISCAFARPDGSHLTDRTRLLRDTVSMKSRKTFARVHIGFVNVNASKAKCSLLAASHI
jgi:hypothetical protein